MGAESIINIVFRDAREKPRKPLYSVLLAGLVLLATTTPSAAQPAGSLEMQGAFVRTGISSNGTLGVGGNTQPGFQFDATGQGDFAGVADYLTPGSPHAGFSLQIGGGTVLVNNNTGPTTGDIPAAGDLQDVGGSGDFDLGVQWDGRIDGQLEMTHVYGMNSDSQFLEIQTTITALEDLDEVKYGYWIDPDSGGTNSINTRGNSGLGLAPEDWVNSISETNGATMGIFSTSDVEHNTAISPAWSVDPNTYLAGSDDQNGDFTIGMGFDIGNMTQGDSVTFQYGFAVADNPDGFGDLTGPSNKFLGDDNANWDNAANWEPAGAPGDGTRIEVDSSVATIDHNVTGNTYAGLQFATDSDATTLDGEDFHFSDGSSIRNRSDEQQTIASAVVAAGDLTLNGGAGGLDVSEVQLADDAQLTLRTTDGNGDVVGPISGNGADVLVRGSGTVHFSAANTYTGNTTVDGARLMVSAVDALPGDVTNDGELEFNLNGDAQFSQNISGSGTIVKSGHGTLTLDGTNSLTGGLEIEGGTVAAAAGAFSSISELAIAELGTLQLNADAPVQFTGEMSGAGRLVKSGAETLRWVNQSTSPTSGQLVDVDVQAGMLIGTNVHAGQARVMSGGTLQATGTFAEGVEVQSGGTVAPGNSIGTLVTNNFTHAAGATLQIEIDHNGNSDQIVANGTATINGGTVEVLPDATADVSQFSVGDRYTFLTSPNPIVGPGFDSVVATGFQFPVVALVRQANQFDLLMVGFEVSGRTFNQKQAGAAMDLSAGAGTQNADLQSVTSVLGTLGQADMQAALDQLSGEIYPTLALGSLQLTDNFYTMFARRIRPWHSDESTWCSGLQLDRAWSASVYGEGLAGRADGDGNALGFDLSSGGTTVLLQRYLARTTACGLALNYTSGSLDLRGAADTAQLDQYRLAGFVRHQLDRNYVTIAAHGGHETYDVARRLAFGTGTGAILRTARSDHEGWQAGSYVELGRHASWNSKMNLQPFLGVQYLRVEQDRFVERDAGGLRLASTGPELNSLRSRLGLNMAMAYWKGVRIGMESIWHHEFLDDSHATARSRLAGDSGSSTFRTRGVDLGRNWATISPTLTANANSHVQLTAAYQLYLNADQRLHGGTAGLTFVW